MWFTSASYYQPAVSVVIWKHEWKNIPRQILFVPEGDMGLSSSSHVALRFISQIVVFMELEVLQLI